MQKIVTALSWLLLPFTALAIARVVIAMDYEYDQQTIFTNTEWLISTYDQLLSSGASYLPFGSQSEPTEPREKAFWTAMMLVFGQIITQMAPYIARKVFIERREILFHLGITAIFASYFFILPSWHQEVNDGNPMFLISFILAPLIVGAIFAPWRALALLSVTAGLLFFGTL